MTNVASSSPGASRALTAVFALLALPMLMGSRGCTWIGEPPTACTTIWAPVCGADGLTYGNRCEAESAGVPVRSEGECELAHCFCTEEYAPVCGVDGLTYSNDCFADCAGVPIGHPGSCESACLCPDVYAPVCGSDGVTYANDCDAECAGATPLHPGACECAPVLCDLYCENGFERDPMTGCETCRCAEPTVACVTDADCGMGTYCDYSECAYLDGELPPNGCVACAGTCRAIEPPPSEWCTADADCGPGARCDLVGCEAICDEGGVCFMTCHGVCVGAPPPERLCTSDVECADGERCNTDACLSLCDPSSGMPCPAVCAGVCEPIAEPPPPPAYCTTDADCALAEHCEIVWCADYPCAPGDPACIAPPCGGYCAPDVMEPPPPEPLPTCASDADCAAGEYCSLPVCIWEVDCPTEGLCTPLGDFAI